MSELPHAEGAADAARKQVDLAIDATRLAARLDPTANLALSPLIRAKEALSTEDGLDWSDGADLETKDIKMPEVIVEDFFRRNEVVLLAGEAKSGKTWNTIYMVVEVCACGTWLGQRVLLGGPVLYVNMELDGRVCELRTKLISRELGKTAKGLHFVHLRGKKMDFDALVAGLVVKAKETGAVLIVLDALYNLLGDRDENANGPMSDLMSDLTRLASETGCAVCAVHHFNKHAHKGDDGTAGATKMSGAGALHRSPESVITITRVGDKVRKALGKEDSMVLRVEASLRTLPEPRPFYIEKTTGTTGIPVFKRLDVTARGLPPGKEPKATLDQLLLWLGDRALSPGVIKAGFSKKMECGERTVETLLTEGLDGGKLVKDAKTYRRPGVEVSRQGAPQH